MVGFTLDRDRLWRTEARTPLSRREAARPKPVSRTQRAGVNSLPECRVRRLSDTAQPPQPQPPPLDELLPQDPHPPESPASSGSGSEGLLILKPDSWRVST